VKTALEIVPGHRFLTVIYLRTLQQERIFADQVIPDFAQ
jgi:hypothetical protein